MKTNISKTRFTQMMINLLFFVIIIFVIILREWLLRAHDAIGVMQLRKESARTVLVLLHNPTARCHDVPKEFAGKKGTIFQTECN
jgi:hypothetical protein